MGQEHKICPQCGGKLKQTSGHDDDSKDFEWRCGGCGSTYSVDGEGYLVPTGGPAMPVQIF
jgi:rRNA maturation endonuclease Nob1